MKNEPSRAKTVTFRGARLSDATANVLFVPSPRRIYSDDTERLLPKKPIVVRVADTCVETVELRLRPMNALPPAAVKARMVASTETPLVSPKRDVELVTVPASVCHAAMW